MINFLIKEGVFLEKKMAISATDLGETIAPVVQKVEQVKGIGPVVTKAADTVVSGPIGEAVVKSVAEGMNAAMQEAGQVRNGAKATLAGESGKVEKPTEILTIQDRLDKISNSFNHLRGAALAVIMEGQMVIDDVRIAYHEAIGEYGKAAKIKAKYAMAPTEQAAHVAQAETTVLAKHLEQYQEGNKRLLEIVMETDQFKSWLSGQGEEIQSLPPNQLILFFESDKPEQILDVLTRTERNVEPGQDPNLKIALMSHRAHAELLLEPSFIRGYEKTWEITIPTTSGSFPNRGI